jgi:hypothetical protein
MIEDYEEIYGENSHEGKCCNSYLYVVTIAVLIVILNLFEGVISLIKPLQTILEG